MKYQRSFVIAVNNTSYIVENNKNEYGYFYFRTNILKNAKIWKYKKTCDNIIENILINPDTSKKYINKKNELSVLEITDKKILRFLKLKKINKNYGNIKS